jgi:hypothetical protein
MMIRGRLAPVALVVGLGCGGSSGTPSGNGADAGPVADGGSILDSGTTPGDGTSPAADGESAGDGSAAACTISFSGAATGSWPCTGTLENTGTLGVLAFVNGTGVVQARLQLEVMGTFSAQTYSSAQFSASSLTAEDNKFAAPTTDGGFGGFASWGCGTGMSPCAISLTLRSVDSLSSGQSVGIGTVTDQAKNTHGSLDVTLPAQPCAGCTTMTVPNLVVHVAF